MTIKKIKKSPTPYLGVPQANRQFFTAQENKLLDQLTIEIMTAWHDDMQKMKKSYTDFERWLIQRKEDLSEFADELSLINEKIPALTSFLEKEEFKNLFEIIESIKNFHFIMIQLSEKVTFLDAHVNVLLKKKKTIPRKKVTLEKNL